MAVIESDIIEALRPVEDPELHRSIVDLGMVRSVAIAGSAVEVQVALTIAGCPLRNEITNRVTDAVTALDGVDTVGIDFTVMTDEERASMYWELACRYLDSIAIDSARYAKLTRTERSQFWR